MSLVWSGPPGMHQERNMERRIPLKGNTGILGASGDGGYEKILSSFGWDPNMLNGSGLRGQASRILKRKHREQSDLHGKNCQLLMCSLWGFDGAHGGQCMLKYCQHIQLYDACWSLYCPPECIKIRNQFQILIFKFRNFQILIGDPK